MKSIFPVSEGYSRTDTPAGRCLGSGPREAQAASAAREGTPGTAPHTGAMDSRERNNRQILSQYLTIEKLWQSSFNKLKLKQEQSEAPVLFTEMKSKRTGQ